MAAQELEALPLTGGALNVRSASDECSPALWKRLVEADDADHAARSIARNPALKAEVAQVAPRLAEWAKPAEPDRIMRKLVELAPIYGIGDRSATEWGVLFRAYLEALAPLPFESIEVACTLWNREASYFPKPGELFKLAEGSANRLRLAAWRARKAAEYVDNLPPPAPSDEDRARVAQMAADLRRELGAKKRDFHHQFPRPARPQFAEADRLRKLADEQQPDEIEEAIG